ncbi:MAG: 3-methyl-2-oxobutanoate hydroxymethyltransferase, partial [Cuspidothrix sp.]
LEHIPAKLALQITQKLRIPTIGIGAGSNCDGQVLVTSDILGLSEKQPPFAKIYTNLRETITNAVQDYAMEVREGKFPE